ncbi:MAG: FAD-dependent oxidoreductase [Candidatus Levybacteria bacterium]|nr:FAD-dependent oxidoreductase [Candidatus Levybacteria bacterium]
MNIAIIGAGFTGLSAAYSLLSSGHKVVVFEKNTKPGGLAMGFKVKGWDWTLEQHYHHWFTNDSHIINLTKALGYEVLTYRPKTSVYVDSKSYQLDSLLQVLKFPRLSFLERVRMSIGLGLIRYDPFWRPLEEYSIEEILPKLIGQKSYSLLWRPLLEAKFGKYAKDISLAWFWARVSKRTSSLSYPYGGFLAFAEFFSKKIIELGGKLYFGCEVSNLSSKKETILTVVNKKGKNYKEKFDAVIVTLPSIFFIKMAPQLPDSYKNSLLMLKGIGAINLILRLKKQFLRDNIYWLSICQKAPVLAIIEHTNYMDKKYYNNEHLVYLGNYLSREHKYFNYTASQLLKEYDPFLQKLNSSYKKIVIDLHLFKATFAQPVYYRNYSKYVPAITTPLKHVYLGNIQQVYPWDRGTTYAVELGEKVANELKKIEMV